MQVLVPWLCAFNAGQPSDKLKELVYRVARAIVNVYEAHKVAQLQREVTERMHLQYVQAAEVALWGGAAARPDPKSILPNKKKKIIIRLTESF